MNADQRMLDTATQYGVSKFHSGVFFLTYSMLHKLHEGLQVKFPIKFILVL